MTDSILVAALCIFSGGAGAFIAWSVVHDPLGSVLSNRVRSAVIVTLKSSETYRGLLSEADANAIVLRNTEALSPDGSRVIVDGELIILRGDVSVIQRP